MDTVKLLLPELVKLCIPMLIGFVCVKTKFLSGDVGAGLASAIARVMLPVMLFCIFLNPELPLELIIDSRWLLLTACGWVLVCFLIGLGLARLLRLPSDKGPVFMILMGMSNVTYMGLPLCTALFGEKLGALGVAMCSLAGHLVMWTAGVMLMGLFEGGEKKFSPRRLLSPVTIAIALAVVLKVCGVVLPEVVYAPLSALGSATPHVALLFIGILIGGADWKSVLSDKSVPIFLVLKLLVLPCLFALFLSFVGAGYLTTEYSGLLMIEFSTSAMISLTAYFRERGLDAGYSAALIFTGVVLNILTLPLIQLVYALL